MSLQTFTFARLFSKQLALISLLSLTVLGQGISITPEAPTVGVGQQLTITANRPALFSIRGQGSINSARGESTVYRAPANITAGHVMAGCMVLPSDSVYNTMINLLPVNPSSDAWTNSALSGGLSVAYKWGISIADNSTPSATGKFLVTANANGTPFPLPPPSSTKRENGSYTNDEAKDHHMIVVDRSDCQFYETNQQGIPLSACPTCTAQSGWTYKSTSYTQPAIRVSGGSADLSGLPLAPLTLHLSELQQGSINHALRFTACAECISPISVWPATASAGTAPGNAPAGARFRLKSSFQTSAFPSDVQAVLTALKYYGMILAGPGESGQISAATDLTEDAKIYKDLLSLSRLTSSDFEVVDESALILSANSNAVNPRNGFIAPANFALLTVTDAMNSSNSIEVPISIEPVMVGTSDPTMVVQAGTPAFQIPYWVTGTTDQTVKWTIAPSTGAGSVSNDGIYTPPSTITSVQTAYIRATSAVAAAASTNITVTLIPGGNVRIDSGSTSSTLDFSGQAWLPQLGFETGGYLTSDSTSSKNLWTDAYNSSIWRSYMYTQGNDIVQKLHVPNGAYEVELMFGVGDCIGSYSTNPSSNGLIWGPLDLELQGKLTLENWNPGEETSYTCQQPATASLLTQVTDTNLVIAVRATGGDNQHSTPLLNGLMITPLASTTGSVGQTSLPTGQTVNIQEFDSSCGKLGSNCRNAFQAALGVLAQAGGGTLALPAGTFLVDFPEIAENVNSAPYFSSKSLIVVPPNTVIQGHVKSDGTPDTIIQWRVNSIPVFVFAKASNSGIKNIHAQFVGNTPTLFPYGDEILLDALGYHPSYPHQNQMSGGNFEMFSFAYVFDSDGCLFNNDLFDSATHDNNHVFGFAINVKGKGVVTTAGAGGLNATALLTQISNITLNDFVMGITMSGQTNATIRNISADRRGSSMAIAPGHVVYVEVQRLYGLGGNVTELPSTGMTIQNISEGADTYSNVNSLGTLAIKGVNGGAVSNITSLHPEGLLQTIDEDENIVFSNMTWSSDQLLCDNAPNNCVTPIINTAPVPSGGMPLRNLTFNNISVSSTLRPIALDLMGDNLVVNGLTIKTPPTFLPGQTATCGALDIRNTSKATISNFVYTPLVSTYSSHGKYNTPLTAWNTSSNVDARVTVYWPEIIPLPTPGSTIITPSSQNPPAFNNALTSTVVLR